MVLKRLIAMINPDDRKYVHVACYNRKVIYVFQEKENNDFESY